MDAPEVDNELPIRGADGQRGDLLKVMGGTLTRNLLRGFFKIAIAGCLSPQALGIVRVVYSLFRITASLAGFGLDFAMVTFTAAAIGRDDRNEENRVLKAVLLLNIGIAAAVLVMGNLFAEKIALLVLGDAGLTLYVRLGFVAVGGQLLWKYLSSYFSAHQQFTILSLFMATTPLLMLLAAAVLIFAGHFDVSGAICIYLFAPAAAVLLWGPRIKRDFLRSSAWSLSLARRIIRFSRWVYLSNLTSAARNHAGPLLLKHPGLSGSIRAGEVNAGLFSFGSDLAAEVTVFSEALSSVLLPKVSGLAKHELKSFLKQAYRNLLLLLVPLTLLIFLAEPMLHCLAYFSKGYLDYLPSIPVFMILYCGTLISLLSIPMKTVLYALKLPQIESFLEIAMLCLLIVACLILIPEYGSIGAAIAVCAQRVVSCAVIIVIGVIQLRKIEKRSC